MKNVAIDINKQVIEIRKYITFSGKKTMSQFLFKNGYYRVSRYAKFAVSYSSVLKKKPNLRVLKLKNLEAFDAKYDIKYLEGKVLVQDLNKSMIKEMNVVTNAKPNEAQLTDMEFGMKVVKYVKSNAICIVKNGVTLAIGGGQTSRVWALENAIHNNQDKDFTGSVLASDAFFPFNDCVQVAANAGVSAIVQPGGSIKDQDSIDLCNELNIPMVFTGYRHFRH